MTEPLAWFGGRLATGLRDVTSDVGALDSRGFWAVLVTFEGAVTCARFEEVRRSALPRRPWRGPARSTWRTSMDEPTYRAAVRHVRDLIAAGEVYQVNVCRVLEAALPAGAGDDLVGLAAALAADNPAPHGGLLMLPQHGVAVASASPELFLSRRGRVVESGPIKGTGRVPGDLTEKDRAENVMIVDLVRNDLGRVCEVGSVEVAALCAVEAHPGLVHLVSTVRGRLVASAGWAELFAATFPAGSVTGAPKRAAQAVVAACEPVPRGPYCGALGWVDASARRGVLAVAIRTFWAAEGRLRFGTGAGITWGSDPAAEWRETELKAERLLAIGSGGVG